MDQNIEHVEHSLECIDEILGRLVHIIVEQLEDGNAVPACLLPFLPSRREAPTVPRVDVVSGHTIGRTIYSPLSQQPQRFVSNHLMKYDDDDRVNGERFTFIHPWIVIFMITLQLLAFPATLVSNSKGMVPLNVTSRHCPFRRRNPGSKLLRHLNPARFQFRRPCQWVN